MQTKYKVSILGLILAASATFAFLQTKKYNGPSTQMHPTVKQFIPTNWDWTKEKWIGDDAPYIKAYKELAADYKTSEPYELLDRCRAAYEKHPNDPMALYRWSLVSTWLPERMQTTWNDTPLLKAYTKVPSPHNYTYTLQHFLAEGKKIGEVNLIPVGKRLLQATPKYISIKTTLLVIMSASQRLEDQKQAVVYAEEMHRDYPDKIITLSYIGETYTSLWYSTQNREDAEHSIAAYEEYLRLTPATDSMIPWMKNLVTTLEQQIAEQDKAAKSATPAVKPTTQKPPAGK